MKKRILAVFCILFSCMFLFVACAKNDGGKEYELPLEEGCRQVTIYYNRDAGYSDCDVWLWYGTVAGRGYAFHECSYGAKVVVNVPDSTEEIGFIIRTNVPSPGGTDWPSSARKDGTDSDRKIALKGDYTVVYTKSGDGNNYSSNDGGKTLDIIRFISMADMQDATHVKVTLSDNSKITKDKVRVQKADGSEVAVTSVSNNVLTLSSPLDLSVAYTVTVEGLDPKPVVPMTYFDSKEFADAYTYEGELGAIYSTESTTFRLWAPTASSVKLNLYDEGKGGTAQTKPLQKGTKGVWQLTVDGDLDGKYYTYTVATSAGENEVVDPYARSAGLNGQRGMVLDLDKTDPEGWSGEAFDTGLENYTDAEIWEVHVRDFSNKITSSKYKGKYLAFTETGLTNANGIPVGVDYLKNLGITHVHLLPSFDYASVDESKSEGFNWGYDPQNYNVPEGSYSTDASDGYKRVNEYKQMVKALHDNGIGVIMDVVYNHTYSADSNFQKIVPYYYYRFNDNGTFSNGSGCGNETASNRSMMRKFIVESVSYWQDEYNLDGFRFDLMALHDITTLQQVEKAVHSANPKALIYGEGWTGGTSTLATSEQATLKNLSKLNSGTSTRGVNGIAMFNDVIRDGVKGSVFNIDDTGFATGAKASYLDNVLFGVTGACSLPTGKFGEGNGWYAGNPTQVINYVSAHDNNTLWDRICHVYTEGGSTLNKRLAMNRLSAAIVHTSLGIPFMQAGEEMLRQKKNADGTYNENSYNASDKVNNIDWSLLSQTSEQYKMMNYYKGLIEFRASSDILRSATAGNSSIGAVCRLVGTNKASVAFTMSIGTNEKLFIVYNANETAVEYTLPTGSWNLYVNGTQAGTTAIQENLTGAQTIDGISCYVFKQTVLA